MRVDYYIKILESKIVTRESGKFFKDRCIALFYKRPQVKVKVF